jgi:hypothetical protein
VDQVVQRIEKVGQLTLQRNFIVGISHRQIDRCKACEGHHPASQYRLTDRILVSAKTGTGIESGSADLESFQRLVGEELL